MTSRYSIIVRSTQQLHQIAGLIICLGLLFTLYGILFVNMSVVSSGVVLMMCGSCITIVAMQARQEALEEELSDP